jgi:hypothetical protein
MRAMVLNGTKMACYDQIKGTVRTCTILFLSLSSRSLRSPLLPTSIPHNHRLTYRLAFHGNAGSIVKSGLVPKGLATQFCAAFGAGFFMACTVAPFDMVRTRLMNQVHTRDTHDPF